MINNKKQTNGNVMSKDAHKNYMNGISYNLSPFATLYIMATSSFFGEDAYYANVSRTKDSDTDKIITYLETIFGSLGEQMHHAASGNNRANSMVEAIEKSLEYDAELTLRFLAWLRTKALMRATPAVGLAIASHSKAVRGTGMLNTVSNEVLSRLDDVTNALAFALSKYGKPIPNSLKKVLAKRLAKASEYELAKYAGKKKEVTLKDAIRLTHANSDAINAFCKEEINLTSEGLETWESIISKEGSNHESWTKSVAVMGHMALLRNLRNLEKHKVNKTLYLDKLVEGAKTGKQLPFRYYSAWVNTKSADIKNALEKCVDISIKNLPKLTGKSLILVDNSGSAKGARVSKLSNVSVSDAGNLMGVLTGLISETGKVGTFGDEIAYIPVNANMKESALQMLETVNRIGKSVGSATENGIWLALKEAIESGEHFERIFIYSDMQAGHGGLYGFDRENYPKFPKELQMNWQCHYIDVAKLVKMYRERVNPDCKLYSIQIGGYTDNITPECFPNTCILGGWSTEILKFVEMYEKNPVHIEDIFRKEFNLPKKN